LKYTVQDIEAYLTDVKTSIKVGRYRIDRNERRPDNLSLFMDYLIDEESAKRILLSLTPRDFSDAVQNKHEGYEHETLYIFGKNVRLAERFGSAVKDVALYIKFNKLENCYVIVISFHEQKHPLPHYFS